MAAVTGGSAPNVHRLTVFAYIFTFSCLWVGIFYTATNFALISQGYGYYVENRWVPLGVGGLGIEGQDFYLTIWLQLGLGVIIIGLVLLYWFWITQGWLQKHPARSMRLLLFLGIITLSLIATHRWYEIMVCVRGNLPSECGL